MPLSWNEIKSRATAFSKEWKGTHRKEADASLQFTTGSLADLYDPNTMPPTLVKAQQQLDKAVDLYYRPQAFINETKRIEFLFELYDKYTSGLFVREKKSKKKK
jgi:hypothetical protein